MAVAILGACHGGAHKDGKSSTASAPSASRTRDDASGFGTRSTDAADAAPVVLAKNPEEKADDDDDEGGGLDAGPRQDVLLKLRILNADAEVFWGAKRVAVGKRGEFLEIERPQHSGPLDLVLRAPGFLPYHTRLFTDRDDNVSVELSRAPARAASPPPPAHAKPRKIKR